MICYVSAVLCCVSWVELEMLCCVVCCCRTLLWLVWEIALNQRGNHLQACSYQTTAAADDLIAHVARSMFDVDVNAASNSLLLLYH